MEEKINICLIDVREGTELHYGLAYMASNIRKNCSSVVDKIDMITTTKNVDYDYDIYFLTCVSQNYTIMEKLCEKLKNNSGGLIVVGGHHITGLKPTSNNFDVQVYGEGENAVLEIINDYVEDKICYEVLIGQPVENLDELPFPMRPEGKMDNVTILTSRGCPFKCVFCSSSHFWKGVRYFSVNYVVSEIKHVIKNHNPKVITLYDDLFVLNKERMRQIADQVKDLNVKFQVLGRTSVFDKETVDILKSMNVESVLFGFESASPKVLEYLKGDNISIENHYNAIKLCIEAGIQVHGSFIIGTPVETNEDVQMTYDFIKNNPIVSGGTYVLTPYPGTALWEECKEKGLVKDDMDYGILSLDFSKDSLYIGSISKEEMIIWYKKFQELWASKYTTSKSFTQIIKEQGITGICRNVLSNPTKVIYAIKTKICGR